MAPGPRRPAGTWSSLGSRRTGSRPRPRPSACFAQFFCQDLNPNLEATLNAEQIPLNFSIALTPSGPVAWHTLPSWYAVSGKDLMVDPAEELFMAQRAGATTVVFPAASHAGGITHYATGFVKLIEEAVQETAD